MHTMISSLKVALTAASGQLGRVIVKQLVAEIGAENVVGTARNPSKAEHLGISIKKGDYNCKADFDAALKGVDVVLIVSGMDAPDKKIVYTSIVSDDGSSTFDAIVQSNRQTEQGIRESGLEWSIGRNGLYIEPDVEYIEQYKKEDKIANCAAGGLCSYTTRSELAYAYAQMILNDDRNGKLFNLAGKAITQQQLTDYLNSAFGTDLVYEEMTPEKYLAFQQKANGEILGKIIAGIYTKIRNGEFNIRSDYKAAYGRRHMGWDDYFNSLIQS